MLDPFAGSGTFGKAAVERERNFFMIESNVEYFEDMKKRFDKNVDINFLNADKL